MPDDAQTWSEFERHVNMTAAQLDRWLGQDRSKAVGQKRSAGRESTGHTSGRRIVTILQTKKDPLEF